MAHTFTPTDTNVSTAGKAKGGGSPTSEGSQPPIDTDLHMLTSLTEK